MNYERLASALLTYVFSNQPLKELREYNPEDPVVAALSSHEWQRIEWSFWAGAYVTCSAAVAIGCDLYDLDNLRLSQLLLSAYHQHIPKDNTSVLVGDYLRNRDDIKALKRSGAVSYSIFSSIEGQQTTRGKMASAIAAHRVRALTEAFSEGFLASGRLAHSETKFMDDFRMPTNVKDGLFREAMVFSGFILDSGRVERTEKSVATTELMSDLLQRSYTELFQVIEDTHNEST
jgi:hypothetical protein